MCILFSGVPDDAFSSSPQPFFDPVVDVVLSVVDVAVVSPQFVVAVVCAVPGIAEHLTEVLVYTTFREY